MVSLEVVAILLSGISISASLFYYASVLQNQNKTRQTQLFMGIHGDHISLPSMTILVELAYEWEWKDMEDFESKYMIPNNKEGHVKFMHYFASMERLGVLIRKGLIDPELIYDSQPGSIIHIWEKFLPVIEEYRARLTAPHLYEDPEYLYEELVKIRERRGHKPMTLSYLERKRTQ